MVLTINLSSLCKGLSDSDEYPYYSDMYKDSYTSNTDEITDDDDFTAGGSAEGSAHGNAEKSGLDENGSSRDESSDGSSSNLSDMDIGADSFREAIEEKLHDIIASETRKFKENFRRHRA